MNGKTGRRQRWWVNNRDWEKEANERKDGKGDSGGGVNNRDWEKEAN